MAKFYETVGSPNPVRYSGCRCHSGGTGTGKCQSRITFPYAGRLGSSFTPTEAGHPVLCRARAIVSDIPIQKHSKGQGLMRKDFSLHFH